MSKKAVEAAEWVMIWKKISFGRPEMPYPDNFREVYSEWRKKKLTLMQAAEACGMSVGTFYEKARKIEKGNGTFPV